MTRFIVVRHGFSEANNAHTFAGITDPPLTEKGKRQAEYVAAYLAKHEKVDHIFYSGLTRTRQTAEPSAAFFGLPLQVERDLVEIFAGLWESKTFREIDEKYHADWRSWIFDFPHCRCTEGESAREHYLRVERAIHRLAAAHEGQTLLLVTHYNPVRVMNAMATGLPFEQVTYPKAPANASINIFCYENGALRVEQQDIITYPPSLSAPWDSPPPPLMKKK